MRRRRSVGQALEGGLQRASDSHCCRPASAVDVQRVGHRVRLPRPHHRPPLRIDATAKAGVSWSRPTLTQLRCGHGRRPVRDRLADGVAGSRGPAPARAPAVAATPSAISEIADQFLLLRVDRDHRLSASRERRRGRVDVCELRVAIRVRRASRAFCRRGDDSRAVQELPTVVALHRPPVAPSRAGPVRGALACPRRGDIGHPRQRFDQQVQGLGDPRLGLPRCPAPCTGWRMRSVVTPAPTLDGPVPDRFRAGQPVADETTRRPRSQSRSIRRRPQPPRTLIEQADPSTTYFATSVAFRGRGRGAPHRVDHVTRTRSKLIHARGLRDCPPSACWAICRA